MTILEEQARARDVFVSSDSPYQRRARILQALWREEMEYPIGLHRGRPLGSRLAMPFAEKTLANYLTEEARSAVRAELESAACEGKLYGYPRIYNDLLSSQPLCFNLFAPMKADPDLAARVLHDLSGGRVHRVTGIRFEHSPGRGSPHYTGDLSAFDVFVEYATEEGGRGFCGIEVKYHEDMKERAARHRPRYDEVAAAMACFQVEALEALRSQPLQQLWRDHLLAGSLLLAGGYQDGFFAIVAPHVNEACALAASRYRSCLSHDGTFRIWAMEDVLAAIQRHTDADWPRAFHHRYLDFGRAG